MNGRLTAEHVWRQQRTWSRAATRVRSSLHLWRSVSLGLAILGAVLATAAAQIGLSAPSGRALSLGAAIALGLVPVLRTTWLSKDRVETWTGLRAASEALKTQLLFYLTQIPPYDDSRRERILLSRSEAIAARVEDLARHLLATADETNATLPAIRDVDTYIDKRVTPQINAYYRTRAAAQQRQLTAFRWVELLLIATAAIFGAVASVTGLAGLAAWVAVATTVAAAITSHTGSMRYEELVISYHSTARRLEHLVHQWQARPDKDDRAAHELVRACEDAISRENGDWVTAWNKIEITAP